MQIGRRRFGTVSYLLLAVLALVTQQGCNAGAAGGSASLFDHQSDQPFATNGHRARMDASVEWDFVRIHEAAAWTHGDSRWPVRDVVAACEEALPRQAWIALDDNEPMRPAPTPNRFADTRVIVCVDPIVAISVPIEDSCEMDSRLVEPDAVVGVAKFGGADINPPLGYRYGTRIPYHPHPTAIIPGAEARQIVVNPDDNGVVRIPVEWGAIELVRNGDEWRARAVGADDDTSAEPHRAAR